MIKVSKMINSMWKEKINQLGSQLGSKAESFTLKERALILMTVIVALYSVWSLLLYGCFLNS